MARFTQSLVLFLLLSLLASCGGGGGGGGGSAPPPNNTSSAANDQVSVDEDSSVTVQPTSNDTRVDESTVSLSSGPSNGTVELSDAQFVYTPNPDFSGTDSFRYGVTGDDGESLTATVTITVVNVNDPPVASPDSFTVIEDNPLVLSLGTNDVDIDDGIASFQITGSFPGDISGSGVDLVYTPALDFTGEVSFLYRAVDSEGANSNEVAVTITVEPVTVTMLEVVQLQIPSSGYSSTNDDELGAAVLNSPAQQITVPPNVVSVLLALNGADANIEENGLFISSLVPPSGEFPGFQRFVNFCFDGNCSSLVPRLPAYVAESGTWTFQVGTLADDVNDIDFSGLTLTAIFRTGPTPDTSAAGSAMISVKPFLTADSISESELAPALTRLEEIAALNQIEFVVESVTIIDETEFSSVSTSFLDSETSSLVTRGDADSVNLFFLEDFSGGEEGLAGISGGVPGSFGTKNGNNGVLINAGTLLADGSETSIQDTAETTFHEIGHLLGLYHTTEARFSFVDVLDDTPVCEESVHDTNNDGVANANECPDAANPMFWFNSVLIEPTVLTDDQKHVLFYSPIAVPGSL